MALSRDLRELWLAGAGSEDDRLLLARLWDLAARAEARSETTAGFFLDERQQAKVSALWRRVGARVPLRLLMWGGSAEADRKVPLFVPEYLVSSADDADLQTIITGLGIDPLAYFRVEFSRQDGPGHRDLLGALLGLGIDRNRTGDILLHDSGAELIVTQNVAETVARDFRQAGHFPLNVQSLGSAEELRVSVPELRILRVTVASLRLDNVLAAVWHLNREKAKELITEGLVTLDGLAELRPAKTVREGQLLRCRGFGKARVLHVGGQSRKGREWVEVGLYV
ncbi:MAG: hypothetical protein EOM03_11390 [Clostridia bacterium]|nr:hypothetical protein [Clostridia bacterium]